VPQRDRFTQVERTEDTGSTSPFWPPMFSTTPDSRCSVRLPTASTAFTIVSPQMGTDDWPLKSTDRFYLSQHVEDMIKVRVQRPIHVRDLENYDNNDTSCRSNIY